MKKAHLGRAILVLLIMFTILGLGSIAFAGDVLFETSVPWYYWWSEIHWGRDTFTHTRQVSIRYTPTANQEVCTIKPGLYKSGNPTDNVTMTVREGGNGYPTGGTVIGTVTVPGNQVSGPPLLAQQSAYTSFTFSPCLKLTAATNYSFVLSRTQPDFNNLYVLQMSNLIYYPQTAVWGYVPVNGFWQESINYEPALRLEGSDKEPVLIIPGIAGSELSNGDDLIWADLNEMKFNLNNDQFISDNLKLNENGLPLVNLTVGDAIKVSRDLLIFEVNIFEDLETVLKDNDYKADKNLFYFPYDWRLNIDHSKDLLKTKIDQIKSQTGAKKVNIVAHSMGGLLAKDYINSYGKDNINKLIFVGTPHLGAPKSARVLLSGDNMGIPYLNSNRVKEVVHNSPATYQLLPDNTYFDNFQGYIQKADSNDLLDYNDSKSFLLNSLNSNIMNLADSFWAKDLENIDLSGINTYNIAGCSTGTEAGYLFKSDNASINKIGRTSGDKTVPLVSADYINIPSDHKFYLKKAHHAEMPSQEDIRTAILNILSDKPASPSGNLKTDQSECKFKGKELLWHSPVAVHIYDSQGRHTGPIENDGIENSIPGVDYQIIDHDKFVFLPTDNGEIYNVVADGLATGSFDLLIFQNDNGVAGNTTVFNDVSIGMSGKVNLSVSDSSSDSSINVDYSGNGASIQNVPASAILSVEESSDVIAPETRSMLNGPAGSAGWYLGNVNVSLSATDDNSGVLETKYSLDGQPFTIYSGSLNISGGGNHVVLYYSVDRAGNNEEVKTVSFGIDMTNIEISTIFNIDEGVFKFEPVNDDLSGMSLVCDQLSCTATNHAGNTTKLTFNLIQEGRRQILSLASISYNGITTAISGNKFVAKLVEKNDILKDFDQTFVIYKEEKLKIDYKQKQDESVVIHRLIPNKPIRETLSGKHFLKLITNKGKIEYRIL